MVFSQGEKRIDKPEDMPEFHGSDDVGVLPHKPRVFEGGPKRTGWKFDNSYPGGQGTRHGKAILVCCVEH